MDNQRSERVERLRQAFGKTSVKAEIPADIHEAVWEKFLLVTAFGGVGAVSRAPIGIIRTMPETRALLQQCMEEVSAVARALGVHLNDSVVSDSMSYVETLRPQIPPRRYRVTLPREAKRTLLLERFGGAARAGGKGLDPGKPVYLSQSTAAGIASTGQRRISAMSMWQLLQTQPNTSRLSICERGYGCVFSRPGI